MQTLRSLSNRLPSQDNQGADLWASAAPVIEPLIVPRIARMGVPARVDRGDPMPAMAETSALDAASRRLTSALDALEAALERQHETEHGEAGLIAQVHALGSDRARLACDLDTAMARARSLES